MDAFFLLPNCSKTFSTMLNRSSLLNFNQLQVTVIQSLKYIFLFSLSFHHCCHSGFCHFSLCNSLTDLFLILGCSFQFFFHLPVEWTFSNKNAPFLKHINGMYSYNFWDKNNILFFSLACKALHNLISTHLSSFIFYQSFIQTIYQKELLSSSKYCALSYFWAVVQALNIIRSFLEYLLWICLLSFYSFIISQLSVIATQLHSMSFFCALIVCISYIRLFN